ncbi:autoinducer binding domain-containing protein [Amaricoccus solimangrovi]|nr:autoinducer binding domain-containing protein [Amaricoccus solimangrovi]
MAHRTSIAGLLRELDRRSPAGFAIALHIRFTAPAYLFQTYPKRWMDHYSEHGMVVNDPTVRWGVQNLGHVRWSDLERIDSAGVLNAAKNHGLMNGATIAIMPDGTRTIASFARADRDYEDFEIEELEDLLSRLHAETAGLPRLSAADRSALRQLSVRLTH